MNKTGEWLKSNVNYGRELVGSGYEGAREGITSALGEQDVKQALTRTAQDQWKLAAVGALAGVVTGLLGRERKSPAKVVSDALVGGSIALIAGMAWSGRDTLGAAARNAARQIGQTRDARWLDRNPITYA